jgi:hypothetical protein
VDDGRRSVTGWNGNGKDETGTAALTGKKSQRIDATLYRLGWVLAGNALCCWNIGKEKYLECSQETLYTTHISARSFVYDFLSYCNFKRRVRSLTASKDRNQTNPFMKPE